MASKIHHLEDISIVRSGIEINVDMSRMEEKLNQAQAKLDSAVMTSMERFMPMDTSSLINMTKAASAALVGSGVVVAAAGPYGRFQYGGKVMIGIKSKSAYAKKDEKKTLTQKNLQYSRAGAKANWFDPAKRQDETKWVEVVKKEMERG